jgi:hypothetical protein
MTEYQIYAVLISMFTALGGGALVYFVTGWLDRRDRNRRNVPAE